MMKVFLLSALITLLLPMSAICASIKVSIYGTYNFVEKTLSVFWNNTAYSSFRVELYTLNVNPNLCQEPTLGILKGTTQTTGHNITFTNLEPGWFRSLIYGGETGTTLVAKQDYYIQPTTKEYTISWCGSESPQFTGVIKYSTAQPTFDFGESDYVPEWKSMTLSKSTSYFTQENMIFVNEGVFSSSGVKEISGPSAQVIVYTVLPEKPTWVGLTD